MRYLLIVLMLFTGCTTNTQKLIDCNDDKIRLQYQLEGIKKQLEQAPDTVVVVEQTEVPVVSDADSALVDSLTSFYQVFKFDLPIPNNGSIGVDSRIWYKDMLLRNTTWLNAKRTNIPKEIVKVKSPTIYLPDPVTEQKLVQVRAERNKYEELYKNTKEIVVTYKWITGILIVILIGSVLMTNYVKIFGLLK
jgi:hypothetical protein